MLQPSLCALRRAKRPSKCSRRGCHCRQTGQAVRCAALKEYLGDDFEQLGKQYDACEVAKAYSGPSYPDILIDQASPLPINHYLIPSQYHACEVAEAYSGLSYPHILID